MSAHPLSMRRVRDLAVETVKAVAIQSERIDQQEAALKAEAKAIVGLADEQKQAAGQLSDLWKLAREHENRLDQFFDSKLEQAEQNKTLKRRIDSLEQHLLRVRALEEWRTRIVAFGDRSFWGRLRWLVLGR